MLYKLQYTHSYDSVTEDCIEYFEKTDNTNAVTEANSRFPDGCTNKKLYNIGTKVSLT